MITITYDVPDISSGHCRAAISANVGALAGVDRVQIDLDAKRVAVSGDLLEESAIRAAIHDAGYEVRS